MITNLLHQEMTKHHTYLNFLVWMRRLTPWVLGGTFRVIGPCGVIIRVTYIAEPSGSAIFLLFLPLCVAYLFWPITDIGEYR